MRPLTIHNLDQETIDKLSRRAIELFFVTDKAYDKELRFVSHLSKLEPDDYKFMCLNSKGGQCQ